MLSHYARIKQVIESFSLFCLVFTSIKYNCVSIIDFVRPFFFRFVLKDCKNKMQKSILMSDFKKKQYIHCNILNYNNMLEFYEQ